MHASGIKKFDEQPSPSPGAYLILKLYKAALFEGSAWKKEGLIPQKEELFKWNLKTNNGK